MRNNNFLYIALVVIFGCAFNAWAQNANRVPFTINPVNQYIMLSANLDDSIAANMMFDTGSHILHLDSSFCAVHPNLSLNMATDTIKEIRLGSAWNPSLKIHSLLYKAFKQVMKIGSSNLIYKPLRVFKLKELFNVDNLDGIFGIPMEDTTHVWELNFEHNYLEMHPTTDFQMPKDCFLLPMIEYGIKTTVVQMQKRDTLSNTTITTTRTTTTGNDNLIVVKFPIQIKCTDEDTLTIDTTYLIDTGSPFDIVLWNGSKDQEFFNKKQNGIWISGYMRYNTVNATLFNKFNIDSLHIYTLDGQVEVDVQCILGLNFLKRFNIYFDMKNHQVGLQPIKNFHRIVNPLQLRFHYSTVKTQEGKNVVTKVGDYPENYFKTAGLQEGDEIVAVNGLPYDNYERRFLHYSLDSLINELHNKKVIYEDRHIFKDNILTFDIIRQGKHIKIVVPIDKKFDRVD